MIISFLALLKCWNLVSISLYLLNLAFNCHSLCQRQVILKWIPLHIDLNIVHPLCYQYRLN